MSRSGSVRLRSALGNNTSGKQQGLIEPSSSTLGLGDSNGTSGYSLSEAAVLTKSSARSSNRRTVNNNSSNHNNNNNSNGSNGPSNNRGGLVNGTSSGNHLNNSNNNSNNLATSITSTRSSSTRSSSTKVLPPPPPSTESSIPMEVDNSDVVNSCSLLQHQSSSSSLEDSGGGGGSGPISNTNKSTEASNFAMVASNPPSSSSTNYNNMNSSSRISDTLLDAVAASSAMEVDPQDDSSSQSSSSESSDSSDSEDSSETDPETSERNRVENHSSLHDLEKIFTFGRELLYKERMQAVDTKLQELHSGRAIDYLAPLEKLQENMSVRIEVTAKLREYRLENLKNKFDAEDLAAKQNYESEKRLLQDSIKTDLEDKIRKLEEDRNNDFTSELWLETALKRKNKKSVDIFGEKKKKAMVVSGPYIVYMLNDVDIVEDWTVIKKAMAAPKRKYVDPSVF